MLKVCAYAKLNLYLDVIGKRADGYHNIEGVFQSIKLCDVLNIFLQSNQIKFISNMSLDPQKNLSFRAAKLLKEEFKVKEGVLINLEKNIPVAAGLGGGSADAAATLIGLDHLWSLNLSPDSLKALAEKLGADVPFCLEGGTSLVEGRGEKIKRLHSLMPFRIVLASPEVPVSTAKMYGKLDASGISPLLHISNILRAIKEKDKTKVSVSLENIFEKVVFNDLPELKKLKEIAYFKGASGALMSGSGPVIFALTDLGDVARRVARAWRGKGVKVYQTSTHNKGVEIIRQ